MPQPPGFSMTKLEKVSPMGPGFWLS